MRTEIIVAIISSGALATFISGLFNLILAHQGRKSGEAAGLQMLLKDRIKHLAKGYISRGSKTAEELEDLIEMHHIYKKLGGNGFCDALMEQVRTIPIVPATPASASEKKSH